VASSPGRRERQSGFLSGLRAVGSQHAPANGLLQTMGGKGVIAWGEPSLGLAASAAKLSNNYCTVLTSWASLITIAQKPWTWGCRRAA
jgi:hypothetical protein